MAGAALKDRQEDDQMCGAALEDDLEAVEVSGATLVIAQTAGRQMSRATVEVDVGGGTALESLE